MELYVLLSSNFTVNSNSGLVEKITQETDYNSIRGK